MDLIKWSSHLNRGNGKEGNRGTGEDGNGGTKTFSIYHFSFLIGGFNFEVQHDSVY